jgi:hypothetical protein
MDSACRLSLRETMVPVQLPPDFRQSIVLAFCADVGCPFADRLSRGAVLPAPISSSSSANRDRESVTNVMKNPNPRLDAE